MENAEVATERCLGGSLYTSRLLATYPQQRPATIRANRGEQQPQTRSELPASIVIGSSHSLDGRASFGLLYP
jgi:hypothetical protein